MRLVAPIGLTWAAVTAITLALYGLSSYRAGEGLQTVTAYLLWAAAVLCLSAVFFRWLQTGLGAALRVAASASTMLFRSLSLVIVGSHRLDRTSELLGAGIAACFAAAIVLMRLQFEVTIAASVHASSD